MANNRSINFLYPLYSDIISDDDYMVPQLYYYVCLNAHQVFIERIRRVYRVMVSGWRPPHRFYPDSAYDVLCPVTKRHIVYETDKYRLALRLFYELSDYIFGISRKMSGLFELDL